MRKLSNYTLPVHLVVIFIYGQAIIFGIDYTGLEGNKKIGLSLFYAYLVPLFIITMTGLNKLLALPLLRVLIDSGASAVKVSIITSILTSFIISLLLTVIFIRSSIDGVLNTIFITIILFISMFILNASNMASFYIQNFSKNISLKNKYITLSKASLVLSLLVFSMFLHLFVSKNLRMID